MGCWCLCMCSATADIATVSSLHAFWCLESPDSLSDVDLATTARDPVHHTGQLACPEAVCMSFTLVRQEWSVRPDQKTTRRLKPLQIDASDLFTHSSHKGDAHYGQAVLLVINRITCCRGVGS